ncbi:MAG: hypothetical protein WDO56_30135 [Gammaproteobacteria bacterium]
MTQSPHASPDTVVPVFVPEEVQFASSAPPLRDWQWLQSSLAELAALSGRAGLSGPDVQALGALCARLNENASERMSLHALRSRLGEGPQRERAEQDLQASITAVQNISFAVGHAAPDQQQELMHRCGQILLGIAATAGVLATSAGSPLFLCGMMATCGLLGLSTMELQRDDTSPGAPEREDLRRVVEEMKELGLTMDDEDFLPTPDAERSAVDEPAG